MGLTNPNPLSSHPAILFVVCARAHADPHGALLNRLLVPQQRRTLDGGEGLPRFFLCSAVHTWLKISRLVSMLVGASLS